MFKSCSTDTGVQTERKRQHKEEKHHKRRRHHQHHRTSTLALQDGIDEHLIEGASLHKLYRLLETVFDAAEQADLGALKDGALLWFIMCLWLIMEFFCVVVVIIAASFDEGKID